MRNLSLSLIIPLLASSVYAQSASETRNLAAFSKAELRGAAAVVLIPDSRDYAEIDVENLPLSDIKTEIRGNTLYVRVVEQKNGKSWKKNAKVRIKLHYRQLEAIASSGAYTLKTESPWKATKIALDLSGATNATLNIDCQTLTIESSGASNLNLEGRANSQKIDMSGAGNLNAYDLLSGDVDIEMSGAGNAKVYASASLRAEANGVGSIRYRGNPKSLNIARGGLGSVRKDD